MVFVMLYVVQMCEIPLAVCFRTNQMIRLTLVNTTNTLLSYSSVSLTLVNNTKYPSFVFFMIAMRLRITLRVTSTRRPLIPAQRTALAAFCGGRLRLSCKASLRHEPYQQPSQSAQRECYAESACMHAVASYFIFLSGTIIE